MKKRAGLSGPQRARAVWAPSTQSPHRSFPSCPGVLVQNHSTKVGAGQGVPGGHYWETLGQDHKVNNVSAQHMSFK